MAKRKIIIGLASLTVVAVGIGAFLFINRGPEMWSMEWKKEQYGPSCEAAKNSGRGMSTNTTEYTVCTRDLGYDIKGIEPNYGNTESTTNSTQQPSQNSSSATPPPSQNNIPSSNESELAKAQKLSCATMRSFTLEEYIESNKASGISEAESRVLYKSAIAQCDALGY